MNAKPTHTATLEQIRAMGNETRLRMLHYFTEAERSEAEVAELLGGSPGSLYYHIRILLKAGLIRQVAVRHSAKKPQAVYRAVADSIELDSKAGGPEMREAVAANIKIMLRIASREVEVALSDEESAELSFMTRQRLWLNPESAAKFQAALDELTAAYSGREGEGQVVCFTAVGAPRIGKNRGAQSETAED